MRLAYLLVAVSLSTGCALFFTGDDGDDVCALAEGTEPSKVARSQPAPLRDPGDLTCDSFDTLPCNSDCGPCPGIAGVAPIPPIPSWNTCGHSCEPLGESACAANPSCRVVKDASCTFESNCLTDFLGCFPIDTIPDATVSCHGADSWDCSRSAACTAIHSQTVCSPDSLNCPRPFELCVPEGTHPGACTGPVSCRQLAPTCPTGTTPGIWAGCYSGACIPSDLCARP
ncbi:MAG: hypothetical protein H0T42_06910 [Deltaproteobacteria bacterium]|nr:hypothetical protein [Deltaproteobacteria bacterium]